MSELVTTPLYRDSNLVAYYRLGGTADSVGTYHLTNNNGVSFEQGKYGLGANFGTGNSNKYLSHTSNMGIVGGAITTGGWIRLLTQTQDCYLLDQRDAGNKVAYFLQYQFNSGNPKILFKRLRNGVTENIVEHTYGGTLGTTNYFPAYITYNNTNMILYTDGIARGTTAASGTGTSNLSSGFQIGARQNSSFAAAVIDDVPVFNRALTPAEITLLSRERYAMLAGEI